MNCAVQGAFYSTGQRCTASSRLIVTEGIHDRFVAGDGRAAAGRSSSTTPSARAPTSARSSTRASSTRTSRISRSGAGKARELAWGGERVDRDHEGFYLAPALFTETTNAMRINREEIFGPVATVIRARDYDEALALANDTPFGLSAGIVHHLAQAREPLQAQARRPAW